jgi:hypothetical protein
VEVVLTPRSVWDGVWHAPPGCRDSWGANRRPLEVSSCRTHSFGFVSRAVPWAQFLVQYL